MTNFLDLLSAPENQFTGRTEPQLKKKGGAMNVRIHSLEKEIETAFQHVKRYSTITIIS